MPALCRRLVLLSAAVGLLFVTAAHAQPLADRVPEDSLLYIGWCGTADPAPGYQGSHAEAVLRGSNIPKLIDQTLPAMLTELGRRDPKARPGLEALRVLSRAAIRYPTAFFIETFDTTNPRKPVPRMALICQAGNDAPALHKLIGDLIAKAPEKEVPLRARDVDGLVVFTIGYMEAETPIAGGKGAAGAGPGPKPLVESAAFANAFRHVQQDPVCVMYLDADKLLRIVDDLASAIPDPAANEVYLRFRESSGLAGVKRVVWTGSFDGADWMTSGFVEAPAPRTGLLSLLDVKPVSKDLLKAIPASATFVTTVKADPARFLAELRAVVGQIDAGAQQKFDQAMGAAQMAVGANLMTEVFEPLGEDWAVYAAPDVAGSGPAGMVVVNRLDDPAKAQASLPALAMFLSSAMQMANKDPKVRLGGRMTKIGDASVYYLGVPFVAPAWTIRDGYLFLGFYPQTVATAADRARELASGGKSILNSEKYQAVQKRLGVEEAVTVSFSDIPASAPQGYQTLLMLGRILGMSDLIGVPLPEPVIPPLHVLSPHLSPAGSAAWVDEAGLHLRSVSPFPCSEMLGGAGVIGPGSALNAAITLPALTRARQAAERARQQSTRVAPATQPD